MGMRPLTFSEIFAGGFVTQQAKSFVVNWTTFIYLSHIKTLDKNILSISWLANHTREDVPTPGPTALPIAFRTMITSSACMRTTKPFNPERPQASHTNAVYL